MELNTAPTKQQQAEAFVQLGLMIDELLHWITSTNHIRPSKIVHLPEGLHDVNDAQAKRIADEHAIVDSLVEIIMQAKQHLIESGASPMSYETQVASRFNGLMHPATQQNIKAYHAYFVQQDQVSQGNLYVQSYVKQLAVLCEMFSRIETLRNAYSHVLYQARQA